MQNFQWEMMAQFIFPAQLGIVEEVISVDIKPRWQEVETEESIRLTGIYHIMASVRFNPSQTPRFSEGTFIEHIEFDGNNGYFEYALPFEVDLPREKISEKDQPRVDIQDLSFLIFDGSSCLFKWDACCVVDEQEQESILDQSNEEVEQPRFENDDVDEMELFESIQHTPTELLKQIDNEQSVEVQEENSSLELIEQSEPPIEQAQEYIVEDSIEREEQTEQNTHFNEQDDTLNYLESIHLPTYGDLIEQQASKPPEVFDTEVEQQERIVEAQPVIEKQKQNVLKLESEEEEHVESNTYLPTDTDDFYNQLSESYTVLKLSNNIIRE